MPQISEFLKAMQEMMETGRFCSCRDESWPQGDDGRNEGLAKRDEGRQISDEANPEKLEANSAELESIVEHREVPKEPSR
jgi:hypothetical protein